MRKTNELDNSDTKVSASDFCPSSSPELGNFKDRLKAAIGHDSIRSFADKCGLSEGVLRNYLRGDTFPTLDRLLAVSVASGVPMAQLATGEGFRQQPGHDEARETFPAYDPSQARQTKVYVLAGAGVPNQLIDTEPIAEIVIPAEFYKPSIVPIMVRGRSMEDTIMDGAFVGVDREDKWVISGEVYAIWIPNEGAVIKRLYLEPQKIICKSDNPKFADFCVNTKEIDEHFIQGRVKWVIQKY